MVNSEGWARRVWFLADLFEVLVIIDFVAILLFDLVLVVLRIEVANIVHDLALGAAYILAFLGILHRSGVQLSGIIANLRGGDGGARPLAAGDPGQRARRHRPPARRLHPHRRLVQLSPDSKVASRRSAGGTPWWRRATGTPSSSPTRLLLGDHITILGQRQDQPVQHRMWVYFNVDFRYSPEEVMNVVEDALQGTPDPERGTFPAAALHLLRLREAGRGQLRLLRRPLLADDLGRTIPPPRRCACASTWR